MKFIYILIMLTTITGCATQPIAIHTPFPNVPEKMLISCPPLILLPDTDKLSILTDVVIKNYTEYNKCKVNNDAWIKWYADQKLIYDKTK